MVMLSFMLSSLSCSKRKKSKDAHSHSVKINCKTNNDCNNLYSCIENTCIHKTFFYPLTVEESVFAGLTLILTGVCMSVGLGAGIFYVPLLTILGKFYIKEAIPISKFLIFVSSIFTSFYHFGQSHPKYQFRSLIDYNLAYFMLPSMLVGVYYGYYLHNIIPNSLIFALLIIVFAILNYSIIKK
jgi:hypothetical protein